MKKILSSLALLFSILTFSAKEAIAIEDPLAAPNNKYGIHIIDESDLTDAAVLVNSTGGDWGYVTIVIQENDRSKDKWQKTFDQMRELHLIPIVRVASTPKGTIWNKLEKGDIDNWLTFLDSLRWPVVNRYVVVGNEPNHAKEWGGKIEPREYASYLKEFSTKAKARHKDFFILPAGLDASAPNLPGHMEESRFIHFMLEEDPRLFDHIDGWTSHSYPNPAFSGSEKDIGKGSIKTFEWERELLKSKGFEKDYPIFITETGWVHSMNGKVPIFTATNKIGEKLKYAYENVWNDTLIVAVTPFLLRYDSYPFESFAWKDTKGFYYPFFYDVVNMPKVAGAPKRIIPRKTPRPSPPPPLLLAKLLYNINPGSSVNYMASFGKI